MRDGLLAKADIDPIKVQGLPAAVGRIVFAMEGWPVCFATELRHADQIPLQANADSGVGATQDEHLGILALVTYIDPLPLFRTPGASIGRPVRLELVAGGPMPPVCDVHASAYIDARRLAKRG